MVYFELEKKDSIINSPYNTRQDQFEDRVVRGSILSADGQTLAYTQVNEDETETRIYPFNNLFAHIVGYDSNGKNGLESLANFELMTSHDGYVKQVKNEMQETKNQGDNVVTTLNTSLQQTAYDALGDNQGAVVVMDPKSGAVLAMVSKPDFNPNTVSQDWDYLTSDSSNSSLLNRATQGAYPPGSVFKIVTTLAYLRSENGNLDNFTYTCDGSITVDDHTISCYDGEEHGTEDFETAFAKSCNSAFAEITYRIFKTEDTFKGLYTSGGDVTVAVCKRFDTAGLSLLDEVLPLAAYGQFLKGEFEGVHIITKGGSQGNKDAINKCITYLKEKLYI